MRVSYGPVAVTSPSLVPDADHITIYTWDVVGWAALDDLLSSGSVWHPRDTRHADVSSSLASDGTKMTTASRAHLSNILYVLSRRWKAPRISPLL